MNPCSPEPWDDHEQAWDALDEQEVWDHFENRYAWDEHQDLEPWDDDEDGKPGDEVDQRLVHRVADGLVADTRIKGRHVQVTVQNGVVILEGDVDSAEVREAAGRRAWATPGVQDVCNMLVPDDW